MMKLTAYKFNLVELSTPLLMLGWSTWFFLFEPLQVSATYTYLAVFPRYLWGAIFAVVAMAKGHSILTSNYKLRRVSAAISVLLWLSLAALFAFGNYRSHLVPTATFFAYQSFLSWQRITPQNN